MYVGVFQYSGPRQGTEGCERGKEARWVASSLLFLAVTGDTRLSSVCTVRKLSGAGYENANDSDIGG